MNDSALDELLASVPAPLPPTLAREAEHLAEATAPARSRRGRMPHPRWFVPLLVGGALALTAGAGVTAVTMAHWAGVSMPIENVRNTVPIPLDWTTETGHVEECRAWIELRNPQPGDRDALDSAIEARDWTGFGQRLYDAAPDDPDDDDGESRVGTTLNEALRIFASSVFPGVHWFSDGYGDSERGVDAIGFRCGPVLP